MEKTKWAIVATGWISHMFAESFAAANDSELVAVCSRTEDKAKAFAKEFDIPEVYWDWETFLNDTSAQVVYIGSPNDAHLDNVLKCFDAGLPVLCEKPMGTNKKETIQMVEAARKKDLFLMEAMWTRFFPAVKAAKKWVDEGRIGDPKLVRVSFCIDNSDSEQWRWNADACGGSLLDLGIYGLAFANYFMGKPPIEQKSFFEVRNGVDISTSIIMNHGDSKFSQIATSFHYKSNHVAGIYGEKGSIEVGEQFWRPNNAKLYKNTGDIFVNDFEEVCDAPYGATGYQYEADAVSEYIREGMKESPLMTLDESIMLAGLMDEMRAEHGVVFPTDK